MTVYGHCRAYRRGVKGESRCFWPFSIVVLVHEGQPPAIHNRLSESSCAVSACRFACCADRPCLRSPSNVHCSHYWDAITGPETPRAPRGTPDARVFPQVTVLRTRSPRPNPRRRAGSLPTTQASCPEGRQVTSPGRLRTRTHRPCGMRRRRRHGNWKCGASQLLVLAIGLTCSDHFSRVTT